MSKTMEDIDVDGFNLTQQQIDSGIRQCLEMRLLSIIGHDAEEGPMYVLTDRGNEFATTAVLHFVALLEPYRELQNKNQAMQDAIEKAKRYRDASSNYSGTQYKRYLEFCAALDDLEAVANE